MRNVLFASAFVVASALTIGATPGNAASGAWCSTSSTAQALECNFVTEAQCEAYVSGVGGTCEINPSFNAVRAQARPLARQARPMSPVIVPNDVSQRP